MKSICILLGTGLVSLLIGCSATPVALTSVGANPGGGVSTASKDAVQVLIRRAGRSQGENPIRNQSSNYGNYTLQGKPVKLANDRIGQHERDPRRAAPLAGIDFVQAQAKDDLSSSEIRIGDSHFVLGGPLLGGLLPNRSGVDQSLGQNLLDLPVIRLLVPKRLPSPAEDGVNYFAWKPSPRPWAAIPTSAPACDDSDSFLNSEPQSGFISLSW